MKTVSFDISNSKATAILRCLTEIGYECEEVSGCLLDNYICDLGTEHHLKMGRYKLRRYLLLKECYANEWSSYYQLILTDDDKTYEVWHKRYLAELEALESA